MKLEHFATIFVLLLATNLPESLADEIECRYKFEIVSSNLRWV